MFCSAEHIQSNWLNWDAVIVNWPKLILNCTIYYRNWPPWIWAETRYVTISPLLKMEIFIDLDGLEDESTEAVDWVKEVNSYLFQTVHLLLLQFQFLEKDEFRDVKRLRTIRLDGNRLSVVIEQLFRMQKNLQHLGEVCHIFLRPSFHFFIPIFMRFCPLKYASAFALCIQMENEFLHL